MPMLEIVKLKDDVFRALRLSNYKNIAYTAAGLFGFTVCYLVYKAGRIYLIRRKYRHIPGPPTKGIFGFFFGNSGYVDEMMSQGKVFSDFLVECNQKYGDVFKYQLGNTVYVSTSNQEGIKEIYVTKNYPFAYESFFGILGERLLGFGIATEPDLKRWKTRRGVFNHGFTRDVLMLLASQFNNTSDLLMDRFRSAADGKTVLTLYDEFSHATLDAISLVAFSLQLDTVNGKNEKFTAAMSNIVSMVSQTFMDPYMEYKPSKRKEIKQTRESARYLRSLARDIINERLKNLNNKEFQSNDILSIILCKWDPNEKMDIEIMIDDIVTLFFAGMDGTASALSSMFLELGRNPEIFKKARDEVDSVLGQRNEITYQDTVNLKYISYLFKETLRLHSPASELFRRNTEEMTINGFKIPINTTLIVSTYACSRNEKFFQDATKFRPERFTKNETGFEKYTYMPFSIGPRNCIGQNFAQLEAIMLTAKFIQKFDFKLDPKQPYSLSDMGLLKPVGGTKCTIALRAT